jgi:hypothetical protein
MLIWGIHIHILSGCKGKTFVFKLSPKTKNEEALEPMMSFTNTPEAILVLVLKRSDHFPTSVDAEAQALLLASI